MYLDVILILGKSIKEKLNFRNTLILLLQDLGFIINQGKSAMIPTQMIEFLDVEKTQRQWLNITTKQSSDDQIETIESISEPSCIHFRINKSP